MASDRAAEQRVRVRVQAVHSWLRALRGIDLPRTRAI